MRKDQIACCGRLNDGARRSRYRNLARVEDFWRRSGVHALADVNFDVGHGEFVSVLGPSGCGESTYFALPPG